MKFTSTPLNRFSPIKPSRCEYRPFINARIQSDRHYLHYSNGVYMGGITSYKRNGKGIVLLDDGTSAITEYCFDSMIGHNILFRDSAIMSILYTKNSQHEIVYRVTGYIIKIPFYQSENRANGNGVLIDYEQSKLYHLIYKHGTIIKKILETNSNILDSVFQGNNLDKIFDRRHQQAITLNFRSGNGINILKNQKTIKIGFADNKNALDGLAFTFTISNDIDLLQNPYESKTLQRGNYVRSKLQNYGQRHFENGNLYIGEFSEDHFNGKGLFIYPKELKWVYGEFLDGNLEKMKSMNTGMNAAESAAALKASLLDIHQMNTDKWMSISLELRSWDAFANKLGEAILSNITDVAVEKEKIKRQEKQRLAQIQQFFKKEKIQTSDTHKIDQNLIKELEKSRQKPEKIVLNEKGSLKPKVLELQSQQRLRLYEDKYYQSYARTPKYLQKSTFQFTQPSQSPKKSVRDKVLQKTFVTNLNFPKTTMANGYRSSSPTKYFASNKIRKQYSYYADQLQ